MMKKSAKIYSIADARAKKARCVALNKKIICDKDYFDVKRIKSAWVVFHWFFSVRPIYLINRLDTRSPGIRWTLVMSVLEVLIRSVRFMTCSVSIRRSLSGQLGLCFHRMVIPVRSQGRGFHQGWSYPDLLESNTDTRRGVLFRKW